MTVSTLFRPVRTPNPWLIALKNKEEVMESPREKLDEINRESAH